MAKPEPPPLAEYAKKRDFKKTPEPSGEAKKAKPTKLPRFVVQQHHATRLHWDFRLERDGVLVSWAVPRGIPPDPKQNHLAVHVEDHPLSYIDFHGEIPEGSYGAGRVTIWDEGTYETLKWSDREVMVVLHGKRVQGRYVLFQTRGKDWMIHRMDPPQDPGREPMPDRIVPMTAKLAPDLPRDQERYGFEYKWDGIRAVAYLSGGRLRLLSRSLEDVTFRYPELRALGEAVGAQEMILDGEVIAVNEKGRPSFERLQERMGLVNERDIKRKMQTVPVAYVIFDLLFLDGHPTMPLAYTERRGLLEGLQLKGKFWQVPPYQAREGETMREASRKLEMEGIMAKRLDSAYHPARRSDAWLKIKNHLRQEVVIGGWLPGEGHREGRIGSLLIGYHRNGDLVYAGKVGTGFTDRMLEELEAKLRPLRRDSSPFTTAEPPPPKGAIFSEPELVGEVEFTEWTRTGQMRHPSFKGLRNDKPAKDVVREQYIASR